MTVSRLPLISFLVVASTLVAGCAGSEQASSTVPESAKLAPADAAVYATLTTDDESTQWRNAEKVLERIPGARDGLAGAIESSLSEEGLTWERDIAPALGPELVIVATAELKPVVLLQPEDDDKLTALLEKGDEEFVRGEVDGWVALAETQAELTAYETSLGRGTLVDDQALTAGLEALPEESLGKVWIDFEAVTSRLDQVRESLPEDFDLGIEWLSMALSAEDNGMLFAMGLRMPGGGDSRYEPELFEEVPEDAVAAISFGGTEGTLDRLRGGADLGEISKEVEKATGISLDRLVDSLSGEGVVYLRNGNGRIPDVTVVLRPPDADETFATVDKLARKLAEEVDARVTTATEFGVEVSSLEVEDVVVKYGRADARTVVVTTGNSAFASLTGDGPKLVDSEGYTRASEDVDLEGLTRGFVYVDVDGLLPLVESLAGGDAVPPDVRQGVEAFDSFILEAGGEGDTTTVRGFLRAND